MERVPPSYDKIKDFISLAHQIAEQSGVRATLEPYMFGKGVMITWLERRRDGRVDLNRFLIELTQLADQDDLGLQLSLQNNDIEMKQEFQRYGFNVVEDALHLQMERLPQHGIVQQEFDFEPTMESAPPGKKSERFIKHSKADFKKRYGKRWKKVLYATAWKQFGESRTFRDYLMLVESTRKD